MLILPVTNDGKRTFTTPIDGTDYVFETYYVVGQNNHWMMNIKDINDNPLITGICLTAGANLLRGKGTLFQGHQLYAVPVSMPNERDFTALGESLLLVWYLPNETSPYTFPDRFDYQGHMSPTMSITMSLNHLRAEVEGLGVVNVEVELG